MVQGGISLRWRVAILTSIAVAILTIVAAVTAYFVVRNSLTGDLQRGLRLDAEKLARIYSGEDETMGQPSSLPPAPTGRVVIQLYDNQGSFLASSNTQFEAEGALIPRDVLTKTYEMGTVANWYGQLVNQDIQAALAPFDRGVVVVLAPTGFIPASLRKLSQSLITTALILIVLSFLIGYIVATTAIRPITHLANLAAQVNPHSPQPLPYSGPADEVGKLSQVLNDLILRLKAALDAQRSFLAETSHELRTPLTSLQGFLERASRRANPDVQRDLDDAKRIAGTMSRLVADLLQLSRGELVEEMVPHLLDPFLDIMRPVSEEFPGVRITGQAGETLVGDPERLRQLVRNLTANAVRVTKRPDQVELRLKSGRQAVVFEVIDDGPGIPAEQLPHIFDKFYKAMSGGAGLGLAIARQIAEAHKGRLEVESTVGHGSTFRLTLPLIDAAVEDTVA